MNTKSLPTILVLLLGLLGVTTLSYSGTPDANYSTFYPSPTNNSKNSTTDTGEAKISFTTPKLAIPESPAGTAPEPGSIQNIEGDLTFTDADGTVKDISIWEKYNNKVYLPLNIPYLGIGTDNPLAGVHIVDMPILAEGMGAIPKEDSGRRLMYYGDKNAFRVGEVSGTQWNDINVGLNSAVVGGIDNTASQVNSGVFAGNRNTASGIGSVVVGGSLNTAFGIGATIIGGTNNTAGDGATVIGSNGVTAPTGTVVIGTPPNGMIGSLQSNRGYLYLQNLLIGAVPGIDLSDYLETLAIIGHISFGSATNRLKPKGTPDYRAEFNLKIRDDGTTIFSTTNLIESSKVSDGNFKIDYTGIGCLQAAHVTFTPINGSPVVVYLKQNSKNTTTAAFVDLDGNPINAAALVTVSCTLDESFDGVHPFDPSAYLNTFFGMSTMSLDPRSGLVGSPMTPFGHTIEHTTGGATLLGP